MRLENKVCVVTGAGRGIGLAVANKFCEEGATVVIAELDEQNAVKASNMLHSQGFAAHALKADVSKAESWRSLVAKIKSDIGRIDVLVNNASIALVGRDNGPEDTAEPAWDETLAVNLKSVYLGCQAVLPGMVSGGGGSIVNIASVVALLGSNPPQIAYTASKGGVVAMTRDIAVTYAQKGVRINCVCPGGVNTEMLAQLSSDPEKERKRNVHIPMKRLARPEEIANAVAFLASDEASYITGQYLCVDGGAYGALITEP